MEEKRKEWSIASLSCGVVGLLLFLMPYFGIVLSILAVVFYAKDKESGLAKSGLVTGIIGIVFNAVMLLFVVLALAVFGL